MHSNEAIGEEALKAGRGRSNSAVAVVAAEAGAPPVAREPAQQPLHLSLIEELRRLINCGDLAPATRIQEKALCERFGVSRTPLREALKVLAAEGLIALLPNRGARVAAFDDEQMLHLFEVIAALEAEGGRLACARIDETAFADIQALHYRMYAHFLRRELPEYFALNQAIHRAILRAAGNPVLLATHTALASRIERARYLANRLHPDRWQAAMAEHEQMLEALRRRDGAGLAALLSVHLRNKQDAILQQMHQRQPVGAPAEAPADL